jgi:hypothetical protein
MEYKRGHKVFIWLQVNDKLKFIKDYDSFMSKNIENTKQFVEELESEIKADNHKVIFMLLSLGLNSKKITRNLQSYWDYCFENRFNYDAFRSLLVQFPKNFKNQKEKIYKELGDIEFNKGKGHFLDVDFHVKQAMEYYKKANDDLGIKKCLEELQINKKNIEENYPKPIEMIIPITEVFLDSNKEYKSEMSGISRVTRTSSNNLIYKELSITDMFDASIVKQNIVSHFCDFFQANECASFDDFLDYFEFKDCWFYDLDLYKLMLPALFHFYDNFKIDIKENNISMVNYVLPLDSLVLKFEGIIRLFLENNGLNIIVEKKGNINENTNITFMLSEFEKILLIDELKKERFNKTDKPFFEHLFGTEELNLRNEIAHSFFKKEYYSHKKVIYIIDAIARIGKY